MSRLSEKRRLEWRRRVRGAGTVLLGSMILGWLVGLAYVRPLLLLQSDLERIRRVTAHRTTTVPVLIRTVGVGTVLGPSDLSLMEIELVYVPRTALRDPLAITGRTVSERMLVGDYVRTERLADPEAGSGLTALIPPGMRALTVNVIDWSRVAGFVQPGDSVDVIVTIPASADGTRRSETKTLAQAVKVLAVDEKISDTATGTEPARIPQVTVAVKPDVAERMLHALKVGSAALTLRSEIDLRTAAETDGQIGTAWIGRQHGRMSVDEFRARVDAAALQRMVDLVMGPPPPDPGPAVDPALLRKVW
ncbi:MAG: Flp pilus assembly protein CpaB [Myxococcota bacterium]